MIGSDLDKPLFGRPVRARRRFHAGAVVSVLGAVALGAIGMVLLNGESDGEPFAVGAIVVKAVEPPAPAPVSPPPATPAPVAEGQAVAAAEPSAGALSSPGASPRAGQRVEIENGVTVIRGMGSGNPGPLTLKVSDPAQKALLGPTAPRPIDPQLVEASGSGPLPRVGRDGRRPALAYAAAPAAGDGKPKIAILIGGMGLDRAATIQASADLPPAVTFGFAPYGDDLDQQAAKVRAAGHEIVLQMPMEDFGRGERPFPHMLKVDQVDNVDRLHWLMSRFAGYAGVGNYLGGRLLADEGSLKPLMKDIDSRGLYFVDDGTATRSLALAVSRDIGLPSIRVDVSIDASADPGAIAHSLSRLEQLARQRGFATGAASGRVASISAIGRFIDEATKRGIVIVPISQAIASADRDKTQAAR